MNKKQILFVLLPFFGMAQNTEILPNETVTNKLVTDSIRVKSPDSIGISRFRSTGARINNLRTGAHSSQTVFSQTITASGNVSGQSGGFVNLSVSGNTTLNTLMAGSVGAQSVIIPNQNFANPLFVDADGVLTKSSPRQYLSLPAAAFFPEQISPFQIQVGAFEMGQIRKFSADGQVEAQSKFNQDLYRLMAPLVYPLAPSFSALSVKDGKICVLDNENARDLAAMIYEVNDSQSQMSLTVNPKMVIRSDGATNTYRCFSLADKGAGEPFAVYATSNSYYVAVFPVSSSVTSDIILKEPLNHIITWQIDNPSLKLVHYISHYDYHN
ncbi:hypothetical protein [Lacihabitans sp. CS3-21]|uniref:hypothetical protein n=1 Tax=Lacihabitans sp. CS3-21 TaxID=2487332 RepID=UPI0020CB832D|nr:hypothetical protein [Lacihabitans sp. CS3-21]MCP9749172.1 hypothetical protein [Lacihabitans sp. CS3-21]